MPKGFKPYKRNNHTKAGPVVATKEHAAALRNLLSDYILGLPAEANADDMFLRLEGLISNVVVNAAICEPELVKDPEVLVGMTLKAITVIAENASRLAINMLVNRQGIDPKIVLKHELKHVEGEGPTNVE